MPLFGSMWALSNGQCPSDVVIQLKCADLTAYGPACG